jgi:hypothetical protein
LQGLLLMLTGGHGAAEASFGDAIALAQRQGAKLFELRASLDLARNWRGQGKVQQARELLAPVYGWFTEGFDTRDLKEAKTLLEELSNAATGTLIVLIPRAPSPPAQVSGLGRIAKVSAELL